MSRISKAQRKLHEQALELVERGNLTESEIRTVYQNYHEGAGRANSWISAHFTPFQIARHMAMETMHENFVDIGAGIGMLSFAMNYYYGKVNCFGVCVERDHSYYEVGKKLLPHFHWIHGDAFDPEVIAEIKSVMGNRKFSLISNPPFGKNVKADTKGILKYTGSKFEYKVAELGAFLGAEQATLLIPQTSAPFRLSGPRESDVLDERHKSREYRKFAKETGLEISPNMGIDTQSLIDLDDAGFKDVSIVTEIALVEYCEQNYVPMIGAGEQSVDIIYHSPPCANISHTQPTLF